MISIIVGTAGHIDHGKTTLVRTLTGIDTDRLEEEKRRGISIELGFAHLDLGDGVRVGFVDVPGHERFIKTMLAGVTGIDLVLLVIAADESIKPQTKEHFDICRFLGVQRGIVVLTKSDLVDSDLLELVKMEVEEFVSGSFLEGAPVVALSSKTGEGIATLQAEIKRLARAVPRRVEERALRLPIDRSFPMKGFGAVVTGTLLAGSLRPEQEVELHPLGRRLRVRGVQVHGAAVPKALAGQRTAVNLAGIEHLDIERGMVLSEPGWFTPVRTVDCRFQLLPDAKPLKHRTLTHVHAGTAETVGTLLLIGEERLEPGQSAWARLRLRDPLMLLPGDRFIVRMFSPLVTIGGGQVAEIDPPKRTSGARLARLAEASPAAAAEALVQESEQGMELLELRRRLGVQPALSPNLMTLGGRVVSKSWVAARQAQMESALAAYHRANPLQAGMPREDLRARILPGASGATLDDLLTLTKKLAAEGDIVRLGSHRVRLQEDESAARAKIESAFRQAGLTTPPLTQVLAECGVEATRARTLLQMLLKEKVLVRISEDLVCHAESIGLLKEQLAGKSGQRFGVAEFKDWTGVSRKYAIPLLELLDRERVTRRDGDQRIVL